MLGELTTRAIFLGMIAMMAIVGVGSACADGQTRGETGPERARNHNLTRLGLSVRSTDMDRDGRPDQWFLSLGDQLIRVERDIDFDGGVDIWQYYDSTGQLIEEEMNLDLDDEIDVVRYYREDSLRRRELATGFDGRFAMVKYYDASGKVLRVERDSDGDGRIDTWEYFEDGEVVRVGHDLDGDGRPELEDNP